MKRWMLVLGAVLALIVVGGAGYLGTRSAQQEKTPSVQTPTTVVVTRGDVQQTVTAPGQLAGTRQVTLALDVSGKLAEVHARPGEQVQAGDVLVQIDTAPLEEKVTAAQVALEVAQAQLAQLQTGPTAAGVAAAQLTLAQAEADLSRLLNGPTAAEMGAAEADVAAAQRDLASLKSKPDPGGVAQARAELERAKVVLQQAQTAYDQIKDRPDVGMSPQARGLQEATIAHQSAQAGLEAASHPATPAELKAARARLSSAQAALAQLQTGPSDQDVQLAEMQVAKAKADLAQLDAGPTAAALKQAQATVQSAELALKQAQADKAAATLTAPFDGVILEVSTQPGETVAAGAGLVVLTDPAALEVQTSVIEEDLPLVQVGQETELFFDARPDTEAQGYVARIVPQRLPGDRPLYPVHIAIADLPDGLLAGMTVDASIVVASRSDVLRLPRALVRARTDGSATIQVWTGSEIEERLVQTGLRGDVHVEILDGLREGEQVVAQ
jgi:HlyD family secretion protein